MKYIERTTEIVEDKYTDYVLETQAIEKKKYVKKMTKFIKKMKL
jgi:hypothetical protein